MTRFGSQRHSKKASYTSTEEDVSALNNDLTSEVTQGKLRASKHRFYVKPQGKSH